MVEGFRLLDLLCVLLCGCHCDVRLVECFVKKKGGSVEAIYVLSAVRTGTLRRVCVGATCLECGASGDQIGSISHFSVRFLWAANNSVQQQRALDMFLWRYCKEYKPARSVTN